MREIEFITWYNANYQDLRLEWAEKNRLENIIYKPLRDTIKFHEYCEDKYYCLKSNNKLISRIN
jgi:hypothetical protein